MFLEAEAFFASCHAAPGEDEAKGGKGLDSEKLGDYWEYDQSKRAWKYIHTRPRKRLYAQVRKDCPFDAKDVLPDRLTELKRKGVTSVYSDIWQIHSRLGISSKSRAGCTWSFPSRPIWPKGQRKGRCSHARPIFQKRKSQAKVSSREVIALLDLKQRLSRMLTRAVEHCRWSFGSSSSEEPKISRGQGSYNV